MTTGNKYFKICHLILVKNAIAKAVSIAPTPISNIAEVLKPERIQ
jgi:hypothetical protein